MQARVLSFRAAFERTAPRVVGRRSGAVDLAATAVDQVSSIKRSCGWSHLQVLDAQGCGVDTPITWKGDSSSVKSRLGGGGNDAALAGNIDNTTPSFRFWRGASGESYVHSAYTLIGCPDVPRSVCVLVRSGSDATSGMPLAILRLEHAADSLNLANIRQIGAKLGANEVHVHVLGNTAEQRRRIEHDLRAALFGASPSN